MTVRRSDVRKIVVAWREGAESSIDVDSLKDLITETHVDGETVYRCTTCDRKLVTIEIGSLLGDKLHGLDLLWIESHYREFHNLLGGR